MHRARKQHHVESKTVHWRASKEIHVSPWTCCGRAVPRCQAYMLLRRFYNLYAFGTAGNHYQQSLCK
jgi:hypothetical protein